MSPSPPDPQDQPPNLAPRYAVERELGRGASAIVYLAHDTTNDRPVAVKVLREELVESVGAQRFLREIRRTAQLQHPRVVAVLDHGETPDERLYYVAPYMDGGTLRERLVRERQLPIGAAVAIAHAVATALDYAHGKGLLHRDVKPENILFSGDEACLGDFGIARALELGSDGGTTTTGLVRGTPDYMSPEQASGERELDGRSDQYSLAYVLFEMLAGVKPFVGATPQAVIAQRLVHAAGPVSRYRPTVPAVLDEVITRALSVTPADRYPTCKAFAEALAGTREMHSTGGTGSGTSTRVLGARRRPLVTAGVTAALVAVTAAGAWVVAADDRSVAAESVGMLTVRVQPARVEVPATDAAAGLELNRALRAELGSWPDVRVPELPGGPASLLVASSATRLGDSVRIVLEVSDRGAEATPRRIIRVVQASKLTALDVIPAIVRETLAGVERDSAPSIETMPGRSLRALREYVSGWRALREGKLDSATARFAAAAAAAPEFGQAALWAAQSGAWIAPSEPRDWAPYAVQAVRVGTLSGADSALASALASMSTRDYPAACASFRAATEVAPESFAGWYGLGECAWLDPVVLVTPRGPRFRSSAWAALLAYREAVARAPSPALLSALFDRVIQATFASGNRVREGRALGAREEALAALPSLEADTLAFYPISVAESRRTGARAVPPTYDAAIRRGRALALDLTDRWVRLAPGSCEAWLQRAFSLELVGRVGTGPAQGSAQAALDRAASTACTGLDHARIAVARTRLALRRGEFDVAARLARRAIADTASHGSAGDRMLAPLAALVGDVDRLQRLSRPDADTDAALPAALIDSLHRFRLRAVVGACEGLDASRRALDRGFALQFAPAELSEQRRRLLQSAYREAVPCLGPQLTAEFPPRAALDEAYRQIAGGDRAGARRTLATARRRRAGANVAALTWDFLFAESWASARAGDSTTARTQLADALGAIESLNINTLQHVPQAAGLRRAVELLRDLGSDRRSHALVARAAPLLNDHPDENRQ